MNKVKAAAELARYTFLGYTFLNLTLACGKLAAKSYKQLITK